MTYHEQLKHPKWQKKRLEVLEANSYTCEECGGNETELHVHHPFYRKGAKVWEYEEEELRCYCKDCHEKHHLADEQIKKILCTLGIGEKAKVFGYLHSVIDMPPQNTENPDYIEGYVNGHRANDDLLFRALKKLYA